MRHHIYYIISFIDNLLYFSKKNNVKQLIIATYNGTANQTKRIVEKIKDTDIVVATVPSYAEIIQGNLRIDNIR